MARARNIKPSFFTNEQLANNEPLGRLLFAGLWTIADYKGDLEWRERTIKIQVLPWDECDIKKLAITLDESGLIKFYSDGDKTYLHIVNFVKHQNPHPNEKKKGSEIPGFNEDMRQVIDLKELKINRDKSRVDSYQYVSDRADSLLLNPSTLIPVIPQSQQVAQQDKPAKKTKVKSDSLDYSVWPELPDDQILKDWIAMRARKKANVSQTVLNAFGEQFRKAATFGYSVNDCLTSAIAGGWTGFKFEWMQNQQARASPPAVYNSPGLPVPLGARSTRDITLVEQLNDRSWAK
jgi:hypothetical protein